MSLSQRELDASYAQMISANLEGIAFDNHVALCKALGRPIEAYRTVRLRCDAVGAWRDWFTALATALDAYLVADVQVCADRILELPDVPQDVQIETLAIVAFVRCFDSAITSGQLDQAQQLYASALRRHPLLAQAPAFAQSRGPENGEPRRIGYFWRHFGYGVNFCMPQHHDRRKYVVIGLGEKNPGVSAPDLGFDAFVEQDPVDPIATIEAFRAAKLDLLVDLNGRGATWRSDLITEARVAPRQATYGNFFGSTFSPSMDALIGDHKFLESLRAAEIAESVIPIDGTIMAVSNQHFAPHDQTRNVPPRPYRFRIGTTGNFLKFSDELIALIVAVLRALPDCSFLYASLPSRDHVQHLNARFAQFGARPDQIELFTANRVDYVSSINALDAAIDAIPYNGHLSTTEFLKLGCPVWSLRGPRPNQNYGRMIMDQIGAPEWVFDDATSLIAALAQNLTVRTNETAAAVQGRLDQSQLWDPIRATRLMEQALDRCLALPPVG